MQDTMIEVDRVWKRFQRGEMHHRLRDLVPALWSALVQRAGGHTEIGEAVPGQSFWALRDVAFQVKRGEAVGIIGPNGAGKSTLFKVLSRILRPNRGRYQVRGKLRALIEVAAGFHEDLTGRENVYLNGAILGMSTREVSQQFDQIVAFAGIEPFLDTPVKRYSSGMKARLGFAVAAHMNPDILLVDEVLSVGDTAFRAKCLQHMQELVRKQVSVLFISHNLEQVRLLCQRCLVLQKGQIRFDGPVEQACEEYYTALQQQQDQTEAADQTNLFAQLVSVEILNPAGQQTQRVQSHDSVILKMQYQVRQQQSSIGFTIVLHTAEGIYVTDCSSIRDQQQFSGSEGLHEVSLTLQDLPLTGQDYFISVRLVNGDTGLSLDYHGQRYPLLVNGEANFRSTLSLKHTWSSF